MSRGSFHGFWISDYSGFNCGGAQAMRALTLVLEKFHFDWIGLARLRGGNGHRARIQRDRADPRQGPAFQCCASGERDGLISHDRSLEDGDGSQCGGSANLPEDVRRFGVASQENLSIGSGGERGRDLENEHGVGIPLRV